MPERKLRVFLCHASQDKPVVRELYQRLLAEGWIDPWLDEEKLQPGQDWDIEIEKAVEIADIVIVCLSTNSVSKEGYVQKELKRILDKAEEKPEDVVFIIPLRLEDCNSPKHLKRYHYLDFFIAEKADRAYELLFTSLAKRASSLGVKIIELRTSAQKINEEKIRQEAERKRGREEQAKIYSQELDVSNRKAEQNTRKKADDIVLKEAEENLNKDRVERNKIEVPFTYAFALFVFCVLAYLPLFLLGWLVVDIVRSNYGEIMAVGFEKVFQWWFWILPFIVGCLPIGGPIIYAKYWPDLIITKLQSYNLDPNIVWNAPSWIPSWLPHQFALHTTVYWFGNSIVLAVNISFISLFILPSIFRVNLPSQKQ